MTRDHVDDARWNEKRRDPPRPLGCELAVCRLDQRQATNARAQNATNALGLLASQCVACRQARIFNRLDGRSQTEVDEGVHVPGFFGGDVILDVEAFDFARKLARKVTCIEAGDVGDARFAFEQIGPTLRHRVAHGADQAKSSDDDAATVHVISGQKIRPFGASVRSRWPTAPW